MENTGSVLFGRTIQNISPLHYANLYYYYYFFIFITYYIDT